MKAEQTWLTATDPRTLHRLIADRATERKLRLWACACARLVLSPGATALRMVEAAEHWADDPTAEGALHDSVHRFLDGRGEDFTGLTSLPIGDAAARLAALPCAREAASRQLTFLARRKDRHPMLSQALRDIMGNPFPVPEFAPPGVVIDLAQSIHDQRAFRRLPLLGDALAEAGCTDSVLMAHCHEPGPHFHGCWVLDFCLGHGGFDGIAARGRKPNEPAFVLPHPAWLVTLSERCTPDDHPLGSLYPAQALPLLARDFPDVLLRPETHVTPLRQDRRVRRVQGVWYLTSEDGIPMPRSQARIERRGIAWTLIYPTSTAAATDLMLLAREQAKGLECGGCGTVGRCTVHRVRKDGLNRDRLFVTCRLCDWFQWWGEEDVSRWQEMVTPCPRCGRPRRLFRVRKEGPNTGRLFARCPDDACASFVWFQPPG